MYKTRTLLIVLVVAVLAIRPDTALAQDVTRPVEWDDYSHSNATAPDYAVVFPQDRVNTITITISPENWQLMLDNMTALYGEFGSTGNRGGFGGERQPGNRMPEGASPGLPPSEGELPDGFTPPGGEFPEGFAPPDMMGGRMAEGAQPPAAMGGMFAGMQSSTENPMWVMADLEFNGQTWTNIGIRFKGNSSLRGAWNNGVYKLPFRFNFDYFEDDYPEIHNQRFFGFKKLSFTNNWNDASFLREKVAADVFREAGIAAAHTAFYAVYIDYGDGPVYFGLYTAVEVVDDTVIETQFDDSSGNLYKPEGTGATFAANTFNEESFRKQTNEKAADYSDILALFDALHADSRLTDPAAWRRGLEAVFDVDGFMHWLAVNSVIQNWDTYGAMAQNYYLYNDPSTGLLTWIPWDLDLSMSSSFGGAGGRAGMGGSRNASIGQDDVGTNWPLIRYLMDDSVYHAIYTAYVEDTINEAFEPTKMETTFRDMHALIAPYVVGDSGENPGYTHLTSEQAFENALTELANHVYQRYELAQQYLERVLIQAH